MAKSVLLKNVRLSYVHLETPASFVQGQGFIEDPEAGNYSAMLLIPKGSAAEKELNLRVDEMKSEALTQGIRESKASGGKLVKLTAKDMLRYNDGVKDGDTKEDEAYQANVYINAKSGAKYKPAAYDKANVKIENSALYSGSYANVFVNLNNYYAAGNIGCSFQLVALQFEADGEPLSRAIDTDSIFGEKQEAVANTSMFD